MIQFLAHDRCYTHPNQNTSQMQKFKRHEHDQAGSKLHFKSPSMNIHGQNETQNTCILSFMPSPMNAFRKKRSLFLLKKWEYILPTKKCYSYFLKLISSINFSYSISLFFFCKKVQIYTFKWYYRFILVSYSSEWYYT
jgi:hypothetical protein